MYKIFIDTLANKIDISNQDIESYINDNLQFVTSKMYLSSLINEGFILSRNIDGKLVAIINWDKRIKLLPRFYSDRSYLNNPDINPLFFSIINYIKRTASIENILYV